MKVHINPVNSSRIKRYGEPIAILNRKLAVSQLMADDFFFLASVEQD
jgi:hypothetical protein